ncbi:sensor histidine kinase [Aliikangiella coralliicola]|uniref:histidine kinase n=1 Tax=Aliikangiella coralliicola TaxID=2592383 RepID=A0A545UB82_9GAMM|nr:ATP-binding protein [Aliikangiella coralliicola]TQV86728.1 GHKL domain-containing protein [Aliikangiella coralliicola]
MPQASSKLSSAPNSSSDFCDVNSINNNDSAQLESVMSELNRLSKSFVHSYQNLEGQVEKLAGQLQSETAKKKTVLEEKQQLLSEKALLSDRLQNLLAIMPAGVVVLDGLGAVKDCNAMAVDILGRPLLGELWVTVINRAFKPQADDGHQISLKDGRKIHIETKALNTEPGQLIVLTDLTKTRKLQAELSQQQKLSSMGKMVAFLAHQIRTPLSAAILYGSHLKSDSLADEMKKEFSCHLVERLHYMERQINDMLNFVKGERKQKSEFLPTHFFNKIKLLLQDFPVAIDLTFTQQKTGDNKLALFDQDAMIGALMNLIDNAYHACSQVENPQIKIAFSVAERLTITVSDNGKGIESEKIEQIFDPFFTDKKNGNGLGLAIVHGVVIDHGGKIRVESQPNRGTVFELTFPLIKASRNKMSLVENLQEEVHEF